MFTLTYPIETGFISSSGYCTLYWVSCTWMQAENICGTEGATVFSWKGCSVWRVRGVVHEEYQLVQHPSVHHLPGCTLMDSCPLKFNCPCLKLHTPSTGQNRERSREGAGRSQATLALLVDGNHSSPSIRIWTSEGAVIAASAGLRAANWAIKQAQGLDIRMLAELTSHMDN